jgi:hypothetical protein
LTRTPDATRSEIDALYQLPLSAFTAARNDLATRLRKAGDRDAGARVAELQKPPASAWAVNALYWTEREAFDAFLAAASRLATAQRAGGPDAFREAQGARRDALQALVKRSTALLERAGHVATADTLGRVSRTLEALAMRGEAPEGERLGCLTADLDPPGFEAFAGLSPTAAPPTPQPRAKVAAPANAAAAARARRAAIEAARDAVAAAEAEMRRRRKAVTEAASRADTARAAQREAERVLSEAAQQARRVTEVAEKAGFEARQAGTALAEAERAVEAAKAAFDRQKRQL